ncbi:MAG: DNA polymerase III subunit gamma/tau [Kiritimatiellia bacterium]|jgi:DNA polymerase-3 subunit gamma/tau|nr:DNA polymerase III subunit gamma/tau [Kiritimatiellia bacterium]MDP6629493.1 DNA polymerase III subunit gamma/tau [Kiritimatiellia bacterium]MDP6809200.1 DNA polymerase III subunit gamma/tau [Kiritimatiellia bacterium]MDP7022939.1 DNA polymerase III subunit gamma/tau [Kiritimatiellia bacterium]
MAYEVIARKWRPQQFSDVVGQGHVVQTLENALASNRIASAYLFVGPRGIGKTSIARIFAKALNCETGLTATPCDTCDNCREIMAGNSLDVLEIDGASNNRVDEVRDLRETVRYAPARGRFKLIIIDEVHMLSNSAFNALLKTLEEPPPHVKFFFATTEPHKIPATIISRCQRFDLRRIAEAEIIERLALIAKDEKVKIEDDALLAIARGSEGGLRDAESALDQLIAFKGKKITEADVLQVFGLVSRRTLDELSEGILAGEMASVIGHVDELEQAGKDLQRLVLELMDGFRNRLVGVYTDGQGDKSEVERLLRICDILAGADERMRFSLSKRILLETALVRCARAAKVATLEEIIAQINALKAEGGVVTMAAAPAEAAPAAPVARRAAPPAAAATAAPPKPAAPKAELAEPTAQPAKPTAQPAAPAGEELATLKAQWPKVVAHAGRIAVAVQGALKDACPAAVEGDTVHLDFDPEFASELSLFESARNRKAVERSLSNVLKRPVTATFQLGQEKAPHVAETPAPEEEYTVEAPPAEPDPPPMRKGNAQAWKQRDEVKQVLDMFNGTIVDVRE